MSMVRYERHGHAVVGTVLESNLHDSLMVSDFGKELLKLNKKHPGICLILNFENVGFLTSAVLTELIRAQKAIEESGGIMRVCGLSSDIYNVFKLTNLHEHFGVKEDESASEAIKRFQRIALRHKEESQWDEREKSQKG